jgi:hypothetical protein
MEYGGRFPGPLARVTAFYLERAQAPNANLCNLEIVIEAAFAHWKEREKLGLAVEDKPPKVRIAQKVSSLFDAILD